MYNQDGEKRGHAIALFSGGLDSALAILLMLRQNIEVTALTFMTHFGCDLGDRSSCGANPYPAAEKYGFNVKLMHLGQKFVDIVERPKFGRGKHMNPCTDCRILMLTEARQFMEMVNADFVITGEVMGQRPMSQVKSRLKITEEESGLAGKLLRPLSAKRLPPTEPELSGMVDREQLEGIEGRSRKRQLELAAQFDLEDYPTPASGCLLTDQGYSNRLRDLMQHTDRLSFDDLNLLKVGRHFRLSPGAKAIVGRHQKDNKLLTGYRQDHHLHLEALGTGSPVTLLVGPDRAQEVIRRAAAITARYCDAKELPEVEVTVSSDSDSSHTLAVKPALDDEIQPFLIK
jgi:tRNA U34 2-thiouridine synthase MnmA/TrmU